MKKGPALADWIFVAPKKHTEFSVELLDHCCVINLPFLYEPNLPRAYFIAIHHKN